ncbi:MAG: radical SAM protein [bacterium]|nr:radical SAM protein [bacterium]
MKITEIYKSLQGESYFSGLSCVFIRTAGCNLRCSYCDTKYAYGPGKTLSVPKIISEIKKYKIKLVEITGGEPLLQEDIGLLTDRLLKDGYSVLIETNGSLDISSLARKVVKIMDIKCPGSKMDGKNRWENIDHLTKNDEIKFVISDEFDYGWAKQKIKEYSLDKKTKISFSSAWESLPPVKLADWIVKDGLNVRFQIQLHKVLWPGKKRA